MFRNRLRITGTFSLHVLGLSLLLLFFSGTAHAQRAIDLDGGSNSGGTVTLNGAQFNAVGDFEIVFRMRDFTPLSRLQGVFQHDNFLIYIPAESYLLCAQDQVSERGECINFSTQTYFKIRRVRATGDTTIEGWNSDGGNRIFKEVKGGTTATMNFAGKLLNVGLSYHSDSAIKAKLDWLRWKDSVGPLNVQPVDCHTDYNLLRYEFENNNNDSSGGNNDLSPRGSASYVDTPNATDTPLARAGEDLTTKPGQTVSLDASATISLNCNVTYTWTQIEGQPVELTGANTATPSFVAPTPIEDNEQLTFRVKAGNSFGSLCDATGSGKSCDTVSVGVVRTDANDLVKISDPVVNFIIGPQLLIGSPKNPFPIYDEIHKRYGEHWGLAHPANPPLRQLLGTVGVSNNVVTGVNTKFTTEIEMNMDTFRQYPRLARRIAICLESGDCNAAGAQYREVEIASVDSDTQLTLVSPWAGDPVSGRQARTKITLGSTETSSSDDFLNASYYDLGYILYQLYYRTGLTKYRDLGRKVADARWKSENIEYGTVFGGTEGLSPRLMGFAGLILRASDGKPEYWDYLHRFGRQQFDNYVFTEHLTKPRLCNAGCNTSIDTRDTGYAIMNVLMLAKALPDRYLRYPGGTRESSPGFELDGASKRTELESDAYSTFEKYVFKVPTPGVVGGVQDADNGWHWDADGFVGIEQPFMNGLFLESAILMRELTFDPARKAFLLGKIKGAVGHLGIYNPGPPARGVYYKDQTVPNVTEFKWRAVPYFSKGGPPTDPTKYNTQPHDIATNAACVDEHGQPYSCSVGNVAGARLLHSMIMHAAAYAYFHDQANGAAYKEAADEMYDSAWGCSDPGSATQPCVYALDDLTRAKNFGENFRSSAHLLVWRMPGPVPPAPPTNLKFQTVSYSTNYFRGSLTWNDNSTDETGFEVERSIRKPSVSPAWGAWETLAQVGENVEKLEDQVIKYGNVEYRYRVRAIKAGTASPYTNTVVVFAVPMDTGADCGGSSGGAQSVVWDNLVNTSASGGTLWKSGGEWDAGANSQQQIGASGGYVEFGVSTGHRMQIGLSNDTSAAVDYTQLKYTFNFWGASGEFDIREGWGNMRLWGTYAPGDVFRIAVENGVVKYYRNGSVIYTSVVAPSYPLVLDTALTALGATVQNAVISVGSPHGIALDGANDGGKVVLPAEAPYNAVGDFELAFRMREVRLYHSQHQHLFTSEQSPIVVRLIANDQWLSVADLTMGGQSAYIAVSTRTYFRIRRIRSTGTITVEGWNADGSNYAIHTLTNGTTALLNFSGPLHVGQPQASWAGGNLKAKIDWLRWRSSVGPTEVRPLDSDTDFDLLRWEFECGPDDSSVNAQHLELFGSPAFEATP